MFLKNMTKTVNIESKTDVEFHETVQLEADDWRQAQIVAGMASYFSDACTVTFEGLVFILTTPTFAAMTDSGKKRMSPHLREKIVDVLKDYAKFELRKDRKKFSKEQRSLDFDKLSSVLSKAYHLSPIDGEEELKRVAGVPWLCSCPQYWHYEKCKHSLGYSIFKGLVQVPPIYRIENIGAVRQPGRQRTARRGDALGE